MTQSEIRHFWELLWGMTEKELRARYKNTVIGFMWIVANPLLQMLIIGFIFPLFIQQSIKNYNYYLFCGLLVWNFFSMSLSKATTSIVFERNLIKKAVFPHEVIPLSIIFSHGIHFLVAMVIFIILLLFSGTLTPFSFIYGLFGLVSLLMFLIGLSLLTSSLNVRYRDVNFFIQAVLIVWFYATPVVYSLTMIPERYHWIWRLNPLTAPLGWIQYALIGSLPPSIEIQAVNAAIIIVTAIAGVSTFHVMSSSFDDWL